MSEPVKELSEAVKAVVETVRSVLDADKDEEGSKAGTRGGPLQVVGRLFVALATIAAIAASASAYFDIHQTATAPISCPTLVLRVLVVVVVAIGAFGGVALVWFLASRNPSLLSSPTEFATSVHQGLMERGEPEGRDKPDTVGRGKGKPVRGKQGGQSETAKRESGPEQGRQIEESAIGEATDVPEARIEPEPAQHDAPQDEPSTVKTDTVKTDSAALTPVESNKTRDRSAGTPDDFDGDGEEQAEPDSHDGPRTRTDDTKTFPENDDKNVGRQIATLIGLGVLAGIVYVAVQCLGPAKTIKNGGRPDSGILGPADGSSSRPVEAVPNTDPSP